LLLFAYLLNRPTHNIPITGIEFEIKKGENSHTLSREFYSQGYIRSELLFIGFVKLFRMESKLKSGWIMIEPGTTTLQLIEKIINAKFITVSFTIPEGSNIEQIKEILINDGILTKQSINAFFSDPYYLKKLGLENYKSAEGFLFPDTYKIQKGVDADVVFKTMVSLFYDKLTMVYPEYSKLSQKQLFEKIIMASIIEREVKDPNEAPIVAGVFYNRLNTHMRLQSCATIQYILGKPKEHLLETDLLVDTPYNTYLYTGLPPGPICTPGFNSLKASFNPQKNDYLFFVVKDTQRGTHHFSRTYEEHLKAQSQYKAQKGFY